MALVPFAAPKYEVDALVPGTTIPGTGLPSAVFSVAHTVTPNPATAGDPVTVEVTYKAASGGPDLPWTWPVTWQPDGNDAPGSFSGPSFEYTYPAAGPGFPSTVFVRDANNVGKSSAEVSVVVV